MSIKTLRKRIALVAVSALGVGLLSVAPASATGVVADDLNITTTSLLQVCVVDTTYDYAYIPVGSAGVEISPTAASAGETAYVTVSGPGIISSTTAGSGGGITVVSATEINISDVADTVANTTFTVKPTGVGTIKVSYSATSTSAELDAISIYVVATCGGGKVVPEDSYYTIVNATEAAEASASDWVDTVVDTASANVVANAGAGYVKIKLFDEYGNTLSAGAMIASVTGPCVVGLAANDGSLAAGSAKTAVLSATGANHVAIVEQETANVGGTCTVTTTYEGVVIGSKTFIMQGAPASIEVSDVTVGATSGYGYYRVTVKDAAGNLLPGKVITGSSTQADNAAALASGIITAVQSNTGAATSSTVGTAYGKTQAVTAANVTTGTSGANGLTRYTCGSAGGAAKLTVRTPVTSAALAYVTSAPFSVLCGGALATWSLSLDKAQYAPGEIATLTVTGKDVSGFAVSTFTLMSGVAYSFGGMTAVTAPTDNDAFASGIGTKTYQFSVGTTEGSFVGTFKTTGSVDTAAKTIQYKIVAPSTGAVTNAEVLAAIVKLIASINKQIKALQKSLKR